MTKIKKTIKKYLQNVLLEQIPKNIFTPIGSWLCKKRKKNEKTSSKVRKVKIQDSLENIADFENIYPKNIRIRLKYHNM
ncbi:hypothetical protein PVIIG_05374 [Plasmodium vivax India VII]|uniref:Uncharacterized protein n=1 Tax=Plasmodium vivax India VII TaxID=1077284 RepID=A0A0J9S2L9_PLAVI|nr:hypothetical protein PVIIG_05374 [Plasmodium vivax India VII]